MTNETTTPNKESKKNIPAQNHTEENPCMNVEKTPAEPEMHAFIIIWLFFGIVIGIIQMLYATIDYVNFQEFYDTPLFVSGMICSALSIVGKVMLLNWHRSGFYLALIAAIATALYNGIYTGFEDIAAIDFTAFISVAILFAILNIKCNNIPYWEAMKIKKAMKQL